MCKFKIDKITYSRRSLEQRMTMAKIRLIVSLNDQPILYIISNLSRSLLIFIIYFQVFTKIAKYALFHLLLFFLLSKNIFVVFHFYFINGFGLFKAIVNFDCKSGCVKNRNIFLHCQKLKEPSRIFKASLHFKMV